MQPSTSSEANMIEVRDQYACHCEREISANFGVQVPKLQVTVVEASEVLGVSRSVVYELMNSARLPSVSIGRSRRIRVCDLEDFVAALPASHS